MKVVVPGIIAGALGALLWAVVTYVTGYELGWIAWAIGAAVGYAVAFGNRDRSRTPEVAGILAVIITALAIIGGKYAAVTLLTPSDDEIIAAFTDRFEEEEYVLSFLADEVAEQFASSGREVAWPAGVDPQNAAEKSDYPAEVWAEAVRMWSDLGEAERIAFTDQRREAVRQSIEENMPQIRATITAGGFRGSFSSMDVVFFALAMVTAFGVASGRKSKKDAETDVARAMRVVMLEVMLADGAIEDEEVSALRAQYRDATGVDLPESVIRAAAVGAGAATNLDSTLGELASTLELAARESIVRAGLSVAVADGVVDDREKAVILQTAAALGISDAHLRGILAQFAEFG